MRCREGIFRALGPSMACGATLVLVMCWAAPSACAKTSPSEWRGGVFGDAAPRSLRDETKPEPPWAKALQAYTYPVSMLKKAGVPVALLSPLGMGGFGTLLLPVGFLLSAMVLAVGRPWMKVAWFYLLSTEIAVILLVTQGYGLAR